MQTAFIMQATRATYARRHGYTTEKENSVDAATDQAAARQTHARGIWSTAGRAQEHGLALGSRQGATRRDLCPAPFGAGRARAFSQGLEVGRFDDAPR